MRQLSPEGQQAVNDIARRHGVSVDAAVSMLDAVINGNGQMAQFSHPEFAGSGQWMRGGMTMISDLFNHSLSARVDALCSELSNLVAAQPGLVRAGSFQSQGQSGSGQFSTTAQSAASTAGQSADIAAQSALTPEGAGRGASLFVPPAPGHSSEWWPSDLQSPASTGSQNGARYAYFPHLQRLVIDVAGTVTVYDTLTHQIGGFSQQQSVGGSLSFNSQHGLIDVASLPVVSVNGAPTQAVAGGPSPAAQASRGAAPGSAAAAPNTTGTAPSAAAPAQRVADLASPGTDARPAPPGGAVGGSQDIFATLEKLADLHAKGILTDEEFTSKKTELLSRL